jgi:sugar diacid utilization regulator
MAAFEALLAAILRIQAAEQNATAFEDLVASEARVLVDADHCILIKAEESVGSGDVLDFVRAALTGFAAGLLGPGELCGIAVRGDDGLLCALCLGRAAERPFSEAELALIQGFAVHAGLALNNAVIGAAAADRRLRLAHALEVERTLAEAFVETSGIDGVCEALGALLGFEVSFEPGVGEEGRLDGGEGPTLIPVVGATRQLGSLRAGHRVSDLRDLAALRVGADLLALELELSYDEAEIREEAAAELFEFLVTAEPPFEALVETRASRLEFDLSGPVAVFAFVDPEPARPTAAVARAMAAVVGGERGRVLVRRAADHVAVAVTISDDEGDRESAAKVAEELARGCALGLSRAHPTLRQANEEALAGLRLAGAAPKRGAVIDAEALGPLRYVLDVEEVNSLIEATATQLEPLRRAEERGGAPLIETLGAYLEVGGYVGAAAERCEIHVSTLKYRIRRVREILDNDLEGEDAYLLWLSFRLLRLLESLGYELWPDPAPTAGST